MTELDVPYWFVGGWSIDLFVGRQTRDHADIDVMLLDRDVESLRPQYEMGWLEPVHHYDVIDWRPGHVFESGPDRIRILPEATGLPKTDILIGLTSGDDWVLPRGNLSVRRPIASLGLVSPDGLPYLAPEVSLRWHSRTPVEKGEYAFSVVAPRLNARQRRWLLDRIPADHRWRPLLVSQHDA